MPRARRNSDVSRDTPQSMTLEAQARRIRQRLDVLGWTDRRLALQIGMSTAYVAKLFTDAPYAKKRSLSAADAWRIARALGLSEMYILYGDRSQLSPEVLATLPPDED